MRPSQMGRRVAGMHGRREHAVILNAHGDEHVSASLLQEKIRKQCGLNIPLGVIHRVMVEENLAREESGKKGKRRRRIRYERTHSDSLWHTDWKQIHGGMHDGRWFLCYEYNTSRFVTGYGIFDSATTKNTLRVLDGAIKNHGGPASIMRTTARSSTRARGDPGEATGVGLRGDWPSSAYTRYSPAWGTPRPTARSSSCTERYSASCTSSRPQ